MKPISRSEWKFVWILAVVVLIITSVPYVFGYVTAPADKQFMGLMQDVPDHGQYLSWWRSFQSAFLVPNKLTPEPNQPLFFNLMWWLLAQISRITGLGYAPIYQLLRIAAGVMLFWAAYRLAAVFLDSVAKRRTALLLLALASGLGWLLVLAKYTVAGGELPYPLLVYIAESNYFLCLLGYPHFALAAALIALALEQVFRAWKEDSIRRMVVAGFVTFVLGWMHAYDLFIIYGMTGTFFVMAWLSRKKFPRRFFWGAAVMALISVWPALYSFLLTSLDPLWKEVLKQFANAGVYTPSPLGLFVLIGLPLFLALAALVDWLRQKQWSDERLFMAGWFAIGALLLYIPTDFQIHMLNSWQFPIMILSAVFLHDRVIPWLGKQFKWPLLGWTAARWAPVLLVLLVLPTNLYLWSWRFVDLARHDAPYYLDKGYVEALDWLHANAHPEQVVLASLNVGQYVPAVSGNTTFLAHWANTVNFYDKQQRAADFFDAAVPDAKRVETASQFNVAYVIFGPMEKKLGAYALSGLAWLQPVYQSGGVTIYQVQAGELAKAKTAP